MKKLIAFFKNLFSPVFAIKGIGEHVQTKTEHGNTVVLFRNKVLYNSDTDDNRITLGTGVAVVIKNGYVGIVQPRRDIYKSGLTFIPFTIFPDDDKEILLDFYLSQNPRIKESAPYYTPYNLGNVIGYVTIVKSL